MRALLVAVVLASAAPAMGQVLMRPTDPPLVNASSEAWYRLREPIQFAGEAYFPSGAAVFFNGNIMVRTGHYNGVPLYADTTMDPYSIIYVPIGRGQLQPYERRRSGDLAGTTGSRPPSYPVALLPDRDRTLMAPTAPTSLPVSIGAIGAFTAEVPTPVAAQMAAPAACACADTPLASTTAAVAPFRVDGVSVISVRRPDNNDGLWVRFGGDTWVSRGMAEPRTTAFEQVGEHAGFPVFRKSGGGDVIYLPARAGLVAPYRRKG